MTQDRTSSQTSYDEKLKWLKVYRRLEQTGLSPGFKEDVKNYILSQKVLGREEEPVLSRIESQGVLSSSQLKPVGVEEETRRSLDELVRQDASWDQMAPLAYRLFALNPNAAMAARLVEYAYLRGSLGQVFEVFLNFKDSVLPFYTQIYPLLRKELLRSVYYSDKRFFLLPFLEAAKPSDFFAEETLYLFLGRVHGGKREQAWQQWSEELASLLKGLEAGFFEVSFASLHYIAASLAYDLSHFNEATNLAKHISPQDDEYQLGLELLLRVGGHRDFLQTSEFGRLWQAAEDPQVRFDLLKRLFLAVKNAQGQLDLKMLGLNFIVKEVFSYFPKLPEVSERISELLCSYVELFEIIPNLFEEYKIRALEILPPDLDLAMWRPLLGLADQDLSPKIKYFVGVAAFHSFLLDERLEADNKLFLAMRLIEKSKVASPGFYSWSQFVERGAQFIEQQTSIEKARRLYTLRSTNQFDLLTVFDLEKYLDLAVVIPTSHLERLLAFAQVRRAFQLELFLLARINRESYLTNSELSRLLALCSHQDEGDLLWRSLTLVRQRGFLSQEVEQIWHISGENRESYLLRQANFRDLDACFSGLALHQSVMLWSFLKIATALPLLCLEAHEAKIKTQNLSADIELDQALLHLKYFQGSKKAYFSEEQSEQARPFQLYCTLKPMNEFARIFLAIAQRMGLPLFNWQLSTLRHWVKTLSVQAKPKWQLFRDDADAVARWSKSLTIEQKSAWQDFYQAMHQQDDEQAFALFFSFVLRLSLVLYPHHSQALQFVYSLPLPLSVIRKFESFLLSNSYGELRHLRGFANKVPIPSSLKKLYPMRYKSLKDQG